MAEKVYSINAPYPGLTRERQQEELNMEKNSAKKSTMSTTRQMTGMAMMTAIVIVLQLLGSLIRFGPFSISLVLVPIVVGAALYGVWAGGWLGFVFGVVVLISGDAAAFLAVNIPATIALCIVKGTLCGLCAGIVHKLMDNKDTVKDDLFAAAAAAFVCPVVNTGVFLLFCSMFFLDTISAWGVAAGFKNTVAYMFLGLAGANFLVELITDSVLTPMIVRLIHVAEKK